MFGIHWWASCQNWNFASEQKGIIKSKIVKSQLKLKDFTQLLLHNQYKIGKSKIVKSQSKSMDSTKTKIMINICYKLHMVINDLKFRIYKIFWLKLTFHPLSLQKLQFWPPFKENGKSGPMFTPFCRTPILTQSTICVMPHVYFLIYFIFLIPRV